MIHCHNYYPKINNNLQCAQLNDCQGLTCGCSKREPDGCFTELDDDAVNARKRHIFFDIVQVLQDTRFTVCFLIKEK